MASTIEFILNATDKITPVVTEAMGKVEKEAKKTAAQIETNWRVGSAAISAAGLAIEGFTKKWAPANEAIKKTASTIDGMTEDSMRKLVLEVTNVTFGIEDVIGVMEKGRQQGIETGEGLKKFAQFWDDVSSATGESAVALADSATALRAVGIEVGNEKEALAAFGFIASETTGTVGEFLNTLNRMGPQVREMGLDINDTAAILGAMERELGMTSRVAMQEFRRAVNESDGDINKLKQSLGLTQEQIEKYRQKVAESANVMEDWAQINYESFTAFDKIKQKLSEVSLALSPYISKMSELAPLMMAFGPAVNIFLSLKGAILKAIPALAGLVTQVWAFTTALLANPLTWWVVGIGLVIAAIVLLYKNWEKVVNFIRDSLDWLADKFKWLETPVNWLKDKLGLLKDETKELKDETEGLATTTDNYAKSADTATTATDNYAKSADSAKIATDGLNASADTLTGTYKSLAEQLEEVDRKHKEFHEASLKWIDEQKKQSEEWERQYSDRLKMVYDKLGVMLPELYEREVKKLDEQKEKMLILIQASKDTAEAKAEATRKALEWYDKEIAKLKGVQAEMEKIGKKKSEVFIVYDPSGKPVRGVSTVDISAAEKELGYTAKKLHTGGIFKAPIPGGEGLALLKDREVVLPAGASSSSGVTINIGAGAVQFVGTEINDATVRKAGNLLFDQITDEMRRRGLSFA